MPDERTPERTRVSFFAKTAKSGRGFDEGEESSSSLAPEEGDGRRPRTALVTALVVGVLVALMVGVMATRDPNTEKITQSPLIGRLAPSIQGTTLSGGSFDLGDQRGRWVVVNFFATWCVPCLEEHPQLLAFDEAHAKTGDASVVSVLFDDKPEKARAVFAQRGGTWPVVIDDEGAVGVSYGVARVPESFLVAPDGTVVRRLVGGVTAAELNSILAQYDDAAGAGS
jgi:cytochrome c biogenesis protein CcmG/thiol:disulfide interchange protein DsbE